MEIIVENEETIVPDRICDRNSGRIYAKKSFLGEGGYGIVYQFEDMQTRTVFAGKTVSKLSMAKRYQRDLITREIAIHESLSHKNIVQFHTSFEDNHNVYIILELCCNRSMMDMLINRGPITEFETRYYMKQNLDGMNYLHSKRVIHRDLKLSNLLLSEDMQVKIADFGMSTKQNVDQLNLTVCGTLLYLAPEIVAETGHSYEVDIWCMGCIMYTLLIGKPPFDSSTKEEIKLKILMCDYQIPSNLSVLSCQLITTMLQPKPQMRLCVASLMENPFFTSGSIPSSLPESCLIMEPSREMIEELCGRSCEQISDVNNNNLVSAKNLEVDIENGLRNLKGQLSSLSLVLKHNTSKEMSYFDEVTDVLHPFVCVNKWTIPLRNKKTVVEEIRYQLSDDTIGVFFADRTYLTMLSNKYNIRYIETNGQEHYFTIKDYPSKMSKKIECLMKDVASMQKLQKATEVVAQREHVDNTRSQEYLYYYQFTKDVIIFLLSDSSLQIDFKDRTKIILCPSKSAVGFIDQTRKFRIYKFETIVKYGCCAALAKCLSYARYKVNELLTSKAFKPVI